MIIAYHHANMIDPAAVDPEKDKISRPGIGGVYLIARLVLLGGSTRYIPVNSPPIHFINQARAVETFRVGPAIFVRRSQIAAGYRNQVLPVSLR